jgi:hypothetical protein
MDECEGEGGENGLERGNIGGKVRKALGFGELFSGIIMKWNLRDFCGFFSEK